MALIRQADAVRMSQHAISLDLGDLASQGAAIIARARAQAEQIVRDAQVERERLLRGACEEGRTNGHEQGLIEGRETGKREGREQALAQSRERLAMLDAAWTKGLDELLAQRAEMLLSAQEQVIELALLLASRVVKRVIESDASVVVEQARAALALATDRSRVRLVVHPEDVSLLRDSLPGLCALLGVQEASGVLLGEDASMARGGVRVEMAGGAMVDASIEGQLDRLAALLLGTGGGA